MSARSAACFAGNRHCKVYGYTCESADPEVGCANVVSVGTRPLNLAWSGKQNMQWVVEPARLTVHEMFRLIEIAHETKEAAIREAALAMLSEARHPGMRV